MLCGFGQIICLLWASTSGTGTRVWMEPRSELDFFSDLKTLEMDAIRRWKIGPQKLIFGKRKDVNDAFMYANDISRREGRSLACPPVTVPTSLPSHPGALCEGREGCADRQNYQLCNQNDLRDLGLVPRPF